MLGRVRAARAGVIDPRIAALDRDDRQTLAEPSTCWGGCSTATSSPHSG